MNLFKTFFYDKDFFNYKLESIFINFEKIGVQFDISQNIYIDLPIFLKLIDKMNNQYFFSLSVNYINQGYENGSLEIENKYFFNIESYPNKIDTTWIEINIEKTVIDISIFGDKSKNVYNFGNAVEQNNYFIYCFILLFNDNSYFLFNNDVLVYSNNLKQNEVEAKSENICKIYNLKCLNK